MGNLWGRTYAGRSVRAFITGLLLVGGAWAGVGLSPISSSGNGGDGLPQASDAAVKAAGAIEGASSALPPDLSRLTTVLPAGEFLVGADVTSLAPDPAKVQWDSPQTPCVKEDQSLAQASIDHLHGVTLEGRAAGWPKSENCIYLGGYGIPGPSRPATGVDPHAGVNVRSIALSNGKDVVLWQMIDMVGYFNKYRADLCADCGILDIRRAISAAVGGKVPAGNIAIGSTHTHGGADGYGVWGGLPTWYREQIRDQVIGSAFAALGAMQPASIAIGEVDARSFNNERRDFYYSTPDYGAVWLQARALPSEAQPDSRVIATLVNFAAHPTVLGAQPLMHGDWPAVAAKRLGDELGGVGLIFEGGLGNVSDDGPRGAQHDHSDLGERPNEEINGYDHVIQIGQDFADFVARDIASGGFRMAANDIVANEVTIEHPVTNGAETGLGLANLLDREFLPGEAAGPAGQYNWSKGVPVRSCASAGPLTIKTQLSSFRVGDLTAVTGPGEVFSNMTEVVKSKARRNADGGGQTMVFGQTQDSLGYIIQSFEVDPLGGIPLQYTEPEPLGSYEETFMLDRCFGDHVLVEQLNVAGRVN